MGHLPAAMLPQAWPASTANFAVEGTAKRRILSRRQQGTGKMAQNIDLLAIEAELGPRFAQGVAERDASDIFVAEHYDALKERKVFSALIPKDIGGGGASYSAMAKFLRALAHYCPSTALALAMHQHIVAANVYNHKNGRPGLKLLERVAGGQVVLISTGANDWL